MTATTLPLPDPFASVVVRRLRRPGTDIAHLFPERAGWSRCLCRAIPWSAALQVAELGANRCADCEAVATEIGATVRDPRIPESELRLLHGNR